MKAVLLAVLLLLMSVTASPSSHFSGNLTGVCRGSTDGMWARTGQTSFPLTASIDTAAKQATLSLQVSDYKTGKDKPATLKYSPDAQPSGNNAFEATGGASPALQGYAVSWCGSFSIGGMGSLNAAFQFMLASGMWGRDTDLSEWLIYKMEGTLPEDLNLNCTFHLKEKPLSPAPATHTQVPLSLIRAPRASVCTVMANVTADEAGPANYISSSLA